MSYVALARKWRPRTFAEMIGQDHVRRALANALDAGKVHHAFLFTGTRGVGKTTVARILAKCLNCEKGVSAQPCGECASCVEIEAGRFVDLIEVDAASRTKVDDTRELLDNVQYAPTRGRYKVYLIDEVHMLSASSFNALLKTLEEPPPHVKFLLATTDPQKLPATVLSRCLQFNLKRLPAALIAERIEHILAAEGVAYESAGVRLVAAAADGSARDGLSLLDQLIAFGGGQVTESAARAMLGTVARDHVLELAGRLASPSGAELLAFAATLEEWAPDYAQLLDELARLLTRIALQQAAPRVEEDGPYSPEALERLARALSPEDVQLYYQIAILGRRDLPLAPDPRTGFEMTLLRMVAFRPADRGEPARSGNPPRAAGERSSASPGAGGGRFAAAGASVGGSAQTGASSAAARGPARPGGTPTGGGALADGGGAQAEGREAPAASGGTAAGSREASTDAAGGAESWSDIVARLELQGAARQLASHCELLERQGSLVRLALDPRHQLVRTRAQEEKLAQALSRHYGEPLRVEVVVAEPRTETPAQAQQRASRAELDATRQALDADPTVRALGERFGATIQPGTVRPAR